MIFLPSQHKRVFARWILLLGLLLTVLPVTPRTPQVAAQRYTGTGTEVMLQGFHWTSYDPAKNGNKRWYQIIKENAPVIKDAGFDYVWFPPPVAQCSR